MFFEWQTSCNPSHALRSLNTGSSSIRGAEDPGVIFQNFLQQATSNQLDTLMGLSNTAAVEDSVIIPCEFCGVQLEEEVLFHHQVRIPRGCLLSPMWVIWECRWCHLASSCILSSEPCFLVAESMVSAFETAEGWGSPPWEQRHLAFDRQALLSAIWELYPWDLGSSSGFSM